jgi:hypothetical protein
MHAYAAMERAKSEPKGRWYTKAAAKPSARQIADIAAIRIADRSDGRFGSPILSHGHVGCQGQ